MARRKNTKRIDPRYFLNETVNRNDDGSALEEGPLRMGPLHPSKWARRVQGWVARKNQELGDLDAVLAAAAESEPEILAMIQAEVDRLRAGGEEELEEGWKEFAQGADDFMGDLMLGKPRGYSKDARQKRARMDADTAALDQRVADRAARKKEKTASDRASAQDRAKRRKAQDIRNRQLDKWEAGQKEKERAERDRKSRERDRDFDGPTRAYRTTYEE